jgi:photosystem II stability/assembly factor-like uncharacterized protein
MGPRRSVLLYLVLLCALALCCAAPALALEPAGDGWYWQSPQPQGNVLNAVVFSDTSTLWAVGDGGTILQSVDAGATWQVRTSPVSVPLGAVTFADPTHGWAVGGEGWAAYQDTERDGVILGTSDGGATWQVQASLKRVALSCVTFIDDQQGWAAGGRGTILHTADGGQTWTAQKSGVKSRIEAVAFMDAQHGFAGCAEGFLLSTTNGGATWKRLAPRGLEFAAVSSLSVGADGKLWALVGGRNVYGNFPRLWSSADGGRTWRHAKVDFRWAIWGLAVQGDDVYAVGPVEEDFGAGDASRVLASHDGGRTWEQHVTGVAQLGAVAAGGPGALCAVGDVTVTSADGGATWQGRSTRGQSTGSIDMVGPAEAWAVGRVPEAGLGSLLLGVSGTLLHTTDGARWQEAPGTEGEAYQDVDFADPGHGWAVGQDGLIRHTADGGASWQTQSSGTTISLGLVAAPTDEAAWALGYRFVRGGIKVALVRTTDAGGTWAGVSVPAGMYPLAATAVSADDAWLSGVRRVRKTTSSVALRTTDGGANWSRVTLPLPATQLAFPVGIDFVDTTHGWLTTLNIEDGSAKVFATIDGGVTWQPAADQDAFGSDIIASISFVDAAEGWASGTGIYHTTDGGRTWARQVSGPMENAFLVDAFDATHALAAGYGMLSTTDTPGDSAPPVTLRDAASGWTRTGVTATLSAADVGESGVASTEYSVDGSVWVSGLTPPPFLAPADHSGDGTRTLWYRSTDLAGNIEPTQMLTVRVDTIKPASKLGRCVVGRDGVLRMRLRIADTSCPSVADFGFGIRTLHGRPIGGVGYEGFRLRTNRWVTLREEDMGEDLAAGRYRLMFYAIDRAGNEEAGYARGLLIVRRHKHPAWPGGKPPMSVAGARGGVVMHEFGARGADPVWASSGLRDRTAGGASQQFTAGLRRLARLVLRSR